MTITIEKLKYLIKDNLKDNNHKDTILEQLDFLFKEKKYTEKDIDKAYWAGMQFVGEDKGSFGEFIQFLQPKTEWEVYFDENGKLKLV